MSSIPQRSEKKMLSSKQAHRTSNIANSSSMQTKINLSQQFDDFDFQ